MDPTCSCCTLKTVLAFVTSKWSFLLMAFQNGRGHQVSFHCSLKGSNDPTWKLQCCMVLMRKGLWSIVSGTEQAPSNDEAENVAKFCCSYIEIEPWHSLYFPLSLHCCTYLVIRMTQLLSGGNCQISFKRRRGLISCSYGKGCILSSWEKGIQCSITFAFWLRYLMSWQSLVPQLKRRTELSTCWQVCQSLTVSLSLSWRQALKCSKWR